MRHRLTYCVGTFTVLIGLGKSSIFPNVHIGLRALKTPFRHPCPAYVVCFYFSLDTALL